MPLDPQVKRYLEAQAALGAPPVGTASPEEQRARMRAQRNMRVEDREVPGPAGAIPVRIYSPAGGGTFPVLVWFHGGGWVVGDLDSTDLTCRLLADWGGCIVFSVNYRHAPEHRFPAAVDDAYAATCWVAANAASVQADAGRIGVGGVSAGGNLAAAVALKAKAEGRPALIYQYLVCPVIDASFDFPSMNENATGYGLSRDAMVWYWDQYVPNKEDRLNPLASPLQEPDLTGLPPAFVITAEYDPRRDEGEAYAARLQAAGVPARLKRYDGMVHAVIGQAADVDGARIALMESADALRSAFAARE
jgi:acetyl esterase